MGPREKDERLICVCGDYIRIRDIEIWNSSRLGLVAGGSYGLYENLTVHDNWDTNIFVMEGRAVYGNTLRNIESFRSRHSGGISVWNEDSTAVPDGGHGDRGQPVLQQWLPT